MSMKAIYVVTKCTGTTVNTMTMNQEVYVCEGDARDSANRFMKAKCSDRFCTALEEGSHNHSGSVRRIQDGIFIDTGEMFQVRIDTLPVDEYDLQDYQRTYCVEMTISEMHNVMVTVKAESADEAERIAKEKAEDGKYSDEYNRDYPDDSEAEILSCCEEEE